MSAGPPPTVSLILPNRNNGPVLDLALGRLAEHTSYPRFELVIVDDGSTDSSRDVLRRWRDSGRFDSFTLLEHEHRGVPAALNAALARAEGELVVQLDADATVETPGWLERMVDFLGSDPRIGVVAPTVIFDTGRVQALGVNLVSPEGLHDRGTRIAEPPGRRTLHTHVTRPRESELGVLARVAEVDASIGCCMLYPRALAEEIGGYDPGFAPVWFDDLDLSLSARRLGRKVFYTPEVRVVHRMSLRNAREDRGGARRALTAARRAAGRVTPQPVKDAVVRAGRLDRLSPEQLERVRRHREHWRRKWGWDLLNPDMPALLERWGETEVCWAHDETMSAAGRQIAEAHQRRITAPPGPGSPRLFAA